MSPIVTYLAVASFGAHSIQRAFFVYFFAAFFFFFLPIESVALMSQPEQ